MHIDFYNLSFSVIMPMKRSSGDVFFNPTLCASPGVTCSDFKERTRFLQEDDSGIKSGKTTNSALSALT